MPKNVENSPDRIKHIRISLALRRLGIYEIYTINKKLVIELLDGDQISIRISKDNDLYEDLQDELLWRMWTSESIEIVLSFLYSNSTAIYS